jgi:hypothetical protein
LKFKLAIWLCVVFVLGGGLWIGLSSAATQESVVGAEPRYLDKSLSEWIPLARLHGDALRPGDFRAFDAVRRIGTNAIPWLLKWLGSDNAETSRIAVEGFCLLGPVASNAIPMLVELANDWQKSFAWSNAMPALAFFSDTNGNSYAIPHLLRLSTNQAAPAEVRRRSVSSITAAGYYNLGTNAGPAISTFILCLEDKDWRVAAVAADALGHYALEPKRTIPALAACLANRTNSLTPSADDPYHWHGDVSVRDNTARALRDFAEVISHPGAWQAKNLYGKCEPLEEYRASMLSAIPALVKALDDEDWRVARDAATALGEAAMEPQVVVPALVKGLDYPHPDVRLAAIEGLGNFGEAASAAVPVLARLAQSDPGGYVGGSFAAHALIKIEPHQPPSSR